MPGHPVRDVVVIVPGIGGSRLKRNGRLVWGGVGFLRALIKPEATLALRGDGYAAEPDVTTDGLLGRLVQLPGLSRIDAYDRLTEQLRACFDFDATNFVEFAYDWRLSCTVNACVLRDRIYPVLRDRRRNNPEAGFVFICHSMGGLVVQQFTDVLEGGIDTKEVITLGTPFRGAVTAFGVLSRGWPPSLPIVRSRFRKLALTFPSIYELLPRYRAIIEGSQRRRMTKKDVAESGMSLELFERADAFHDKLDGSSPRPYGRTVIVGSLQPTAQFVEVRAGKVHILNHWMRAQITHDERGDGTVPRQSVTPPEWPDDRHAVPFPQTHIGLPTADNVFRVLYNVLTAKPRQEQAEARAKLAITVPDLVVAGTQVDVGCEVVEGDAEVPVLVKIEAVNSPTPPWLVSPRPHDGKLIASFPVLQPGDYRVSLRPATTMPDVQPVWDALTVVEPDLPRDVDLPEEE